MIDFRMLNQALPVREVLDLLGLRYASIQGRHWRGKCPFHQSASVVSRSLMVDLYAAKFFCHKCHEFGDILDLWSRVKGVTLVAAAQELQRQFRVGPVRE